MDPALEAVLLEVALGPSRRLDLGLDDELPPLHSVIGAELPGDCEGFLGVESDLAAWDADTVVVDDLSGVVLVEDHGASGEGAQESLAASLLSGIHSMNSVKHVYPLINRNYNDL